MRLLTASDLQLWDRCRRQWASSFGEGTPDGGGARTAAMCCSDPVPADMIGLVSIREHARVVATALEVFASDCEDLTPEEALAAEVPASAWMLRTGRNAESIRRWDLRTREALAAGTPFVNGALAAEGFLTGIDCGRFHHRMNGWSFQLFRPATGVRGFFEDEATLLLGLCRLADLAVSEVRVVYLDKSKRSPEVTDTAIPEEWWKLLFRESNVTGLAGRSWRSMRERMDALYAVAVGENGISPDYRCERDCRFCNGSTEEGIAEPVAGPVPGPFNVLTLHKGRHIGRELVREGVSDMRDIDLEGRKFSERQRIQIRTVRSGAPHVDRDRLAKFLDTLEWPLFFLDFEAFSQSIPPAAGLAPYEHVPVVASIHRQDQPFGDAAAEAFVTKPGHDQRRAMYSWLSAETAAKGTIVVYSLPFESAMVRQLGSSADDAQGAGRIVERMVDLLKPFNEFMLYHPEQCGKVSLKKVLPIYTGSDYESVSVRDGLHANLSFTRRSDRVVAKTRETFLSAGARAAERATAYLSNDEPATLEEISRYCAQDTLALAELVNRLLELRDGGLRDGDE